jgi:hypothetical protein
MHASRHHDTMSAALIVGALLAIIAAACLLDSHEVHPDPAPVESRL